MNRFDWADWLSQRVGDNQVGRRLAALAENGRRQAIITAIADEAMARAGFPAHKVAYRLSDVGLLAYRSPQNPKLVRAMPIMTDTLYLRPFARSACVGAGRPPCALPSCNRMASPSSLTIRPPG
ncbi:MAG: hypothetical protein HC915_08645 [Anaerolineae bacterium]|nr:hypothetical protein [Anaerolineae bacterium]